MKEFYSWPRSRNTMPMLLVLALLAFYLSSLAMAFAITVARQAIVQGIGLCAVACVAALTLWMQTQTGLIEPWLSIAMIGVIALPGGLIGLGLALGGLTRITAQHRGWKHGLACLGAAAPAVLGVYAAFAQ